MFPAVDDAYSRDHGRRAYKRQRTKALGVDGLVRVWWSLERRYDQDSEAYLINYLEMVRFFHLLDQSAWC